MNFTTYYRWYQYPSVVHRCMIIMWFYWITILTLVNQTSCLVYIYTLKQKSAIKQAGLGHPFTFMTVLL